ncbi:hypothetical protein BLS_008941 [Venturia inaequalis]|uniref:Uncharacterized protein n=1 Tax=Venturia inaequalis TaxID=5025 RepID=A0A8H3VJK2_VENIN|nr:hypothetical protein EG328_001730 [Venturia inaequalis]KAE9980226.1 hypothetical protein BLS_008941 [Venturia inaequalis]KAE9989581.1 hypothetical protein EG327_002500 [Venturia inaequalis]RDI81397.1 Calcium-binding protein [Venturia inaequalis]
MKIYIIAAFFLILPFAHGFEFASAKTINLCRRIRNEGYGWGRLTIRTTSASCIDNKNLHVLCHFTHPASYFSTEQYECEGDDESCIPHSEGTSPQPDAGCLVLHSPSGVKGSGDSDNHACSSGIKIGNDDIYILSTISADNPLYASGLRTCIIGKSGTSAPTDRIYSSNPCSKTSTLLKLAARTTYQACVTTAVALAKTSVGFTWHIRAPGKTVRRGLELGQQGKPLSEMFTIVGNNTANDGLRIVIED